METVSVKQNMLQIKLKRNSNICSLCQNVDMRYQLHAIKYLICFYRKLKSVKLLSYSCSYITLHVKDQSNTSACVCLWPYSV